MRVIFAITRRLLISDDVGAWQHRILMSRGDIWLSLLCPFSTIKNVKSVCSLSSKSTPPDRYRFFTDTSRRAGLIESKGRKGWEKGIEALSFWYLSEWINKSWDCRVPAGSQMCSGSFFFSFFFLPFQHRLVEPSLRDVGRRRGRSATPWSAHLSPSLLVNIQMCKGERGGLARECVKQRRRITWRLLGAAFGCIT